MNFLQIVKIDTNLLNIFLNIKKTLNAGVDIILYLFIIISFFF